MGSLHLVDSLGHPLHIAIDGFVATGKTTVGMAVARRLGMLFLDTGVLYRAITLIVRQTHIDVEDESACGVLAEVFDVRLIPPTIDDGRAATVLAGPRDITLEVRSTEVDHFVPRVAAHPRVRQAVRWRQHQIAEQQPVVMVGRDITTVVLPSAQVKVMLTAPLEVRLKRRHAELQAQHPDATIDVGRLRAEIVERDSHDSVRTLEVHTTNVIDTTHLTVEQIVDEIVVLAAEATDPNGTTLKLPKTRKQVKTQ